MSGASLDRIEAELRTSFTKLQEVIDRLPQHKRFSVGLELQHAQSRILELIKKIRRTS